jgi:hypothetical protein
VVPPVYSRMMSSPSRSQRGSGRGVAGAATGSYGTAHGGQDPFPSSTQSQASTPGTDARVRSIVAVKDPANTTARASQSCHR